MILTPERAHEMYRVMKRREKIVRSQWSSNWRGYYEEPTILKEPHRLAKYNLSCSCSMCRRDDPSVARYLELKKAPSIET